METASWLDESKNFRLVTRFLFIFPSFFAKNREWVINEKK